MIYDQHDTDFDEPKDPPDTDWIETEEIRTGSADAFAMSLAFFSSLIAAVVLFYLIGMIR